MDKSIFETDSLGEKRYLCLFGLFRAYLWRFCFRMNEWTHLALPESRLVWSSCATSISIETSTFLNRVEPHVKCSCDTVER